MPVRHAAAAATADAANDAGAATPAAAAAAKAHPPTSSGPQREAAAAAGQAKPLTTTEAEAQRTKLKGCLGALLLLLQLMLQ